MLYYNRSRISVRYDNSHNQIKINNKNKIDFFILSDSYLILSRQSNKITSIQMYSAKFEKNKKKLVFLFYKD